MQILELLKQRRIWASIFGAIAILLPLFGVHFTFDTTNYTDAVMAFINGLCGLLAIILPIISYFKPKK